MRFGIMAMQINSLIPASLSGDKILAYITGFDHANLVRGLAAYGFNPIELGGDLSLFLPHTFSPSSIERLASLKSEIGIGYTLHLPLWSVEPSTPLSPVRLGSVQSLIQSIEATRVLEPENYVLHATGALAAEFYHMRLPELARSLILQQFQSGARDSIQKILAETGIPSRKLAIETVEFPFDLTVDLADELDLSICFDTGHILVGFAGPIDFFGAFERCLPRLAEIHLHDGVWQGPDHNIGYGKDHRPLGNGDLEIAAFLDRLQTAKFNGPLIFELRVEEAMPSLELIRSLRPDAVS